MHLMRWFAILTAGLLLTACFYPWITIESRDIVVSGFSSDIREFGKPGVFHLVVTGICTVFLLINRIWSARVAFFISVLNIPWAIRNFFLLSGCSGGICPQRQPALYIVVAASLALSILIVFIDTRRRSA